jgi:hypothetical protein
MTPRRGKGSVSGEHPSKCEPNRSPGRTPAGEPAAFLGSPHVRSGKARREHADTSMATHVVAPRRPWAGRHRLVSSPEAACWNVPQAFHILPLPTPQGFRPMLANSPGYHPNPSDGFRRIHSRGHWTIIVERSQTIPTPSSVAPLTTTPRSPCSGQRRTSQGGPTNSTSSSGCRPSMVPLSATAVG